MKTSMNMNTSMNININIFIIFYMYNAYEYKFNYFTSATNLERDSNECQLLTRFDLCPLTTTQA